MYEYVLYIDDTSHVNDANDVDDDVGGVDMLLTLMMMYILLVSCLSPGRCRSSRGNGFGQWVGIAEWVSQEVFSIDDIGDWHRTIRTVASE